MTDVQDTIAKRINEITARHVPVAEGTWKPLHEDRDCACGQVWHVEADAPILGAFMDDPDGTWPEHYISAVARFVAHAQQDIPFLLETIEELRGVIAAIVHDTAGWDIHGGEDYYVSADLVDRARALLEKIEGTP